MEWKEKEESRGGGRKKRKFVRKISGPRSEIPPSNGPACCPAVPCWAMGSCSSPPVRPTPLWARRTTLRSPAPPSCSLPPLVGHSRGEGDINYLGQRYAKFSHNTKKGTRMGEKDGRFVVLQGALFSPLVHERDSPISPTFDKLPFLPCVSLEHELDQSLFFMPPPVAVGACCLLGKFLSFLFPSSPPS